MRNLNTWRKLAPSLSLPLHRPRPGQIILLHDTFSGAGAIGTHSPEIPGGTPWTVGNGGFNDLSGGLLTTALNNSRAAVDLSPDYNVEIEASLYMGPNYTTGLLLRYTSNTAYYKLILNRNGGRFELYRYTALKISVPYSFNPETLYSLQAWAYQARLVVFYAGALLIDYVDEAPLAFSTRFGYDAGGWAAGSGINELRITRALDWKHLSVIGDSISVPGELWPARLARLYNGGRTWIDNHADDGDTILPQSGNDLDAQVAAAASDQPHSVILQLGTNDNTASGVQAKVEENLQALHSAHPQARLFYMAPLPCTSGTAYNSAALSAIRDAIQAACSASGLATFWDTYSDPWIDPAQDTLDGLHPNDQGHAKIAARVLERL